jgi:hypothetical protein
LSPFGLNFFFLFLEKKSSVQMVLNQHIRRKKDEFFFCDIKLLTTNRTTVPSIFRNWRGVFVDESGYIS